MIVSPDPFEPITAEQWDALRARWPNGERLTVAWRLARDVDALHDLLAGLPVSPERLKLDEVERARELRLVQLVAPLDLLENAMVAA